MNNWILIYFVILHCRKYGKASIIMVDIKEFIRFIYKFDKGGLVVGGRYHPIHDIFENFFGEMRRNDARLVSFWILFDGKFDNWNYRKNHHAVFDCIKNQESLADHLQKENRQPTNILESPCERIYYNVIRLPESHGDVIVSCTPNECSILSYPRQHYKDTFALITGNTDYLVFDDDFDFWTISTLKIYHFSIEEIDWGALKNALGLRFIEMQLPRWNDRVCTMFQGWMVCLPLFKFRMN